MQQPAPAGKTHKNEYMTIMKKFITLTLLSVLTAVSVSAQTSENYKTRYQLLVNKLGPTGVGIETLLDKWQEAYPDDLDMLTGRFSYYLSKAQSNAVITRDQNKYLGADPLLTLKDSTGKSINYFQDINYDDELFGKSQQAIEKAIQLNPDRLDLRLLKSASLIGYEKESPDMALSDLKSLIIYNETVHPSWTYPETEKVDEEFFSAAVQEYCYLFFKYASPTSYEAFRELSETMLKYRPNDILYLNDLGSYYLVAKRDDKTALKYYTKVLKIKQDDLTAIKNIVILARNSGNVKLEKKYLPLLQKYSTSESEKLSAKARLESLK